MSIWKAFRPATTMHPFSLSLAGENLIFISGITGHQPDGSLGATVDAQTRDAFASVAVLLEREGSSLDEIVWVHPYATTIENGLATGPAFTELFPEAPPACGALIGNVTFVDPDMLVEFDVVAARGATRQPA
ncbi:Rid family hydrolase [Streptomyces sp. NPDC029554]|uniref:RidA family protein n=1 Tax=Streptomyces sp. NPDC029554 TaxID=3155126 RepID=UPI0033D75DB2